jgi:PBSX family phage terminase large subunit
LNLSKILTPKQLQAFKLLCEPVQLTSLYGGGRSGKTFVILVFIIIASLMKPNCRTLIFRKHLSTLKASLIAITLPKVMQVLDIPPGSYTYNHTEHLLTFINGSAIKFIGIASLQDAEKILGTEYTYIWNNESSETDPEILFLLFSRLAQNIGLKRKMIVDFNPPKKTHWTFGLITFSKISSQSGDLRLTINHLHMNPDENPYLTKDFMAMLDGCPESYRKRFLLGEFGNPDNALIDVALIKPTLIHKQRFSRVIIAIDPAATNNERSDETGLVAIGRTGERYIILKDLTIKAKPEKWAAIALNAKEFYSKISDDVSICAETNQGGDMIKSVLDNIATRMGISYRYTPVHTMKNKLLRADDFSAFLSSHYVEYDEAGNFEQLFQQLDNFEEIIKDGKSPDRADALLIGFAAMSTHKLLFA